MIVTVVLMLGALVAAGRIPGNPHRHRTRPPRSPRSPSQACGALMLGAPAPAPAPALACASSWTAKLSILLSSAILLTTRTYTYRRAHQHSHSPDRPAAWHRTPTRELRR